MTTEREALEAVIRLNAGASTEDIAGRAEAIRDRLTRQLAGQVASARAAEREKLSLELAEALGVPPEVATSLGWSSLTGMVLGVRTIGDMVLGHALPDVDEDRRKELLVSFGVAEYWARVRATAQLVGPTYREALGLDDGPDAARGGPMGDEGVGPGSPLEAELNSSLERPPDSGGDRP